MDDFSTTSRFHTSIHHITRSSQHEDAIGFQRSNSIAMRCCWASFFASLPLNPPLASTAPTRRRTDLHMNFSSRPLRIHAMYQKIHAVPKHVLQKNLSHTMICIGFQFFDHFISRCVRTQLFLADACQKLDLFMLLLHPPNSLCRALPRLKHWDTYKDGATSDPCGDPLVRGRNQGLGTRGSAQRRVSGDSSTTTSSKKNRTVTGIGALALPGTGWPFCRLFLGCAATRSDLCAAQSAWPYSMPPTLFFFFVEGTSDIHQLRCCMSLDFDRVFLLP